MNLRLLALLLSGGALPTAMPEAQSARFAELHRMFPRNDLAGTDVDLADVDGDGDLDAFVFTKTMDRLYRNAGDARFDAVLGIPPSGGTVASALADLDGDGDLDLLRAVSDPLQQHLALGDGLGGFVEAPFPPNEILLAMDLAVGDVDGDGDLDVVFGGFPLFWTTGGRTALFLNDGAAAFADASAQMPAHQDSTNALVLEDLDGDGDLDLLVGNVGTYAGEPDRLYANQGGGTFVDASAGIPAQWDETRDLDVADVDLDGDLDVFLANYGSTGSCKLWRNAGGLAFDDASDGLPSSLAGTSCARFLHANGDAAPDLFLGGWSPGAVGSVLLLGDGTGGFSVAGAPMPDQASFTRAAAGDVDADGDDDLLLVGTDLDLIGMAGVRARLWLGAGNGSFGAADEDLAEESTGSVILTADLDGDGFTDVLLARSPADEGPNFLYLGGAGGVGGRFEEAHDQLPWSATGVYSGALGDVDGDGDLDALWGTGEADRLERNDGSATFVDASGQLPPLPLLGTSAVALADVDGDGDVDALLGRNPSSLFAPTDGENLVLRNDGGGFFSVQTGALPVHYELTLGIEMADVDGDGDVDALVRDVTVPFQPGIDRLHRNDGTGTFTEDAGALPYHDFGYGAAVFTDFDADGAMELFLGGGGTDVPDLFLQNDGSGVFVDASAGLPAAAAGTKRAAAGDVDEDGTLDLFVTDDVRALLLLGDGTGGFADGSAGLPELGGDGVGSVTGLALADLDGDGDLDAWFPGAGPDRLWWNLGRQIAWRALPRVGKELVADVYGPALGPWVAAHSTATAFVDLPPFGMLYLDPVHMPLLGSGLLDADGRAALPLAIPATPALVGVEVFAQAAVGALPRLTNADVALFTNL